MIEQLTDKLDGLQILEIAFFQYQGNHTVIRITDQELERICFLRQVLRDGKLSFIAKRTTCTVEADISIRRVNL